MTKNLKISALLLFLLSSCLTNENDESNEVIKTDSSAVDFALDIESEKESQLDIQMSKPSNPLNLKIVSPDQLKVDGYQRYFLNDTVFTGLSRKYEGDLIVFEVQFNKGKKDGVSTFWHENGIKKSILTFKNGSAKGEFKVWDKNGNLVKEGVN